MREELKRILEDRILREIAPQSPLKLLRGFDLESCLNNVISVVYLYTRMKRGVNKTVYLTEVISAIGHNIINENRIKRDSALAAKIGAFFLYSFEQLDLIQVLLGQGNGGHNSYIIQVEDDDTLVELWESIPANQIEKLPSEIPYAPWLDTRHESGVYMIKTGNKDVLNAVSPTTHPMLFDGLNRAQAVGWRVNRDIYDIQNWALRNKVAAFNDIWEQRNAEAKTTKLREARAISGMAKRFLEKTFYHLYYYDFRGRRYPTTAYLHEQGSDISRGLLLRSDAKRIGEVGLRWLFISVASCWGGDSGRDDGLKTDKIPLSERVSWTNDNMEILLSYAESPKVNQGWMEADKPWQFLAGCFELAKVFECDNPEDYVSSLEVFIDGSNNGLQHLAALTRDEVTGLHVNIIPSRLPGDIYNYVAEFAWNEIENVVSEIEPSLRKHVDNFIDNIIDLKKQLNDSEPRSDRRKILAEQLKECREENADLNEMAAPMFWHRVMDVKHRRKVVKRNVMTLPYGGTQYGLGQQQIDDARRHGIELLLSMEHKWGSYLGRLIYNNCRQSLARPMQLLNIFEKAGRNAEEKGRFLSWTVPVTNFPVVQNYTQGKVRKIWVQYGPPTGKRLSTGYFSNTLQLNVCFIEDVEPAKGRQGQGASPNLIHSLDAAHLIMTVCRADFPVTTIHDSYGCLLADMPELYNKVRETFVELYENNPLHGLMDDIEGDVSGVSFGDLNIKDVLNSEYCFV